MVTSLSSSITCSVVRTVAGKSTWFRFLSSGGRSCLRGAVVISGCLGDFPFGMTGSRSAPGDGYSLGYGVSTLLNLRGENFLLRPWSQRHFHAYLFSHGSLHADF
ncbi:hypothetical protein AALP_AA8G381600 [Arabis alpina]|uniref:Uncharacterized protein n=1 Tax=Arabis alpina TaxID=50452 RepID=A0A087GC29_ARAAL|nr:hypothetical protein AALP_AA8G381600 [Arabis alpina]